MKLSFTSGEIMNYESIDSVCDSDDTFHDPMKFLNSSEISGLPLILTLASVMVLRNLNRL